MIGRQWKERGAQKWNTSAALDGGCLIEHAEP
jgi:hypothetical protein